MERLKWNKVFAMEQVADDVDLLNELLGIFKHSCAQDMKNIVQGIEEKDSSTVRAASHSIKGAAASLGLEGIREIAASIEEDSKAGSLKDAEDKIQELKELLLCIERM